MKPEKTEGKDFFPNLSHKLKNPLASLKNIAYYLEQTDTNKNPENSKMIKLMSSEINKINEIIKEYIDSKEKTDV
ncbi:histidine kinase dimerization/phospho-acceptor domain-containing protein [Elusimicrobiota bacterium]